MNDSLNDLRESPAAMAPWLNIPAPIWHIDFKMLSIFLTSDHLILICHA